MTGKKAYWILEIGRSLPLSPKQRAPRLRYHDNNNNTKYTHPVKNLYIIIKSDNIYIFIRKLPGYISTILYTKLFLKQ